ncbi:unnamed protein product [Gordionus sp. m RMFG-2023]
MCESDLYKFRTDDNKTQCTNCEARKTVEYRNLIVNHKFKFIFCIVPKIASTQWKLVLGALQSDMKDLGKENEGFLKPNKLWHASKEYKFERLSEFTSIDQAKIMRDYKKVIFVRHPLERIISAFWSKFIERKSNYFIDYPKIYGVSIIKKFKLKSNKASTNRKYLHFYEFIKWLNLENSTELIRNRDLDSHWSPIYEICHVCNKDFTFDFIGHFEHQRDDYQNFLDYITNDFKNIPNLKKELFPWKDWPIRHSVSKNISSMLLSQVNTLDLTEFYKSFHLDYLLFNYSYIYP